MVSRKRPDGVRLTLTLSFASEVWWRRAPNHKVEEFFNIQRISVAFYTLTGWKAMDSNTREALDGLEGLGQQTDTPACHIATVD